MKFKELLVKIKDVFINALYPADIKCIFCERDVPKGKYYICDYCLREDIFNDGNKCQICDSRIKEGNIVCDHCKNHKRPFKRLYCPFNYTTVVRKALIKFKSDGAMYLAPAFASFIADKLELEEVEFDVIVPVPSHKKTIKKRGYNPARVLADELSKITKVPVADVLEKVTITKNQKALDYTSRQTNLKNSIILTDKKALKNKKVLIIDDIITTGATIENCASLMTMADEIYGCAVARSNF